MKSFGDGRFQVEKKLGQGAQGLVYLARDTHLDRAVAIKVLHSQPLQALNEAQLVSRIQHPNIVTLYDAFADHAHPCLVFEYVAGETLGDYLRREKKMQPVAAVKMMIAILAGLHAAHEKGVIHRDMKPQNIILDDEKQPRIMDFGVASQRGQSYEGLQGTAGFISPEMINNLPVDAQADVFACGVILYQMLTGKLVADGESVMAILYRTAHEAFDPPSNFNDQIDEQLDHLVMAALFKNPEARYSDAGEMRVALLDWLDTAGGENGAESSDARHSTIEFLLRRLRHSADFPALSQTIAAINRVDESNAEKVQSLSGVILQDFSLTNKLLKIVNSASFGQFGGSISTVSRAIVILGFDRIRSLAVTILLFEHMQNKGHAARLRDVVLEIFFGGVLCRKLAEKSGWRDVEEALICGMFQHLGRLLTHFYFNEESLEIIKRKTQTGERESIAAEAILGVSYAELGVAIAKEWNFPDRIVISMRPLPETKVKEPANQSERLRVFANLASDLLPVIAMKAQESVPHMQKLMQHYISVVPWSEREFREILQEAAKQYLAYLSVLQIELGSATFANQLRALAGLKPELGAGGQDTSSLVAESGLTVPPTITNPAAMLSAGIQDITNTLVGDFNLNDVLRMILETMFRSVGFDRVLFCTRDVKKGTMVARFGFGKEVDAILPKFSFPVSPLADVFQLVLARNADVFIEDVDAESIAQRIPDWYRTLSQAKTLVVFPVVVDKKPIGLFYADRFAAHSLHLPHEQLNLLKTLRNQAILAIRQKQMGG
ncbi:HDOD domain-containing protein [Chitinibacter bivalviorum]|uniref:HDOD domain-containing protein n=1 Tax=Chitinibacter bivalviorum TaxID=2739434 RepID=A0A7H9BF93_9NEIS|nr:serine/threonine protein kinase [Chitinibacter bivalviorum]QLG87373.1 HDOD domain-containing protein [Chitinibacter bivalviorum]